jgi:glycosyltransferase involved in cell wall biosynthesis
MAEASMMTALTRPFAANPLRVASYHHVDFDIHPADRLRRRVRKAVYAGLMRNAVDAHVGISRAVARHYERHLGLKKVEVISNGFPVSQLQKYLCPDPLAVRRALGITEQFVAVCPARFSSEKGHEYLLEAIAILRKEKHSICLLLYGRGMLEQKLRVDCAVLGIADVVRFMGVVAQEELMPALAASDALVLPSPQGEGFGRVLAEAMVLGIPVITPGVGGALDFVDHRGNGLLVEPASPAAIAGALRELILDTGLRQDLGRAARKRVEGDFDIRICGDRWEELFARLMSTRHG